MAYAGTLLAIFVLPLSVASSFGTGTTLPPPPAYNRAAGYTREDGEGEQEEVVPKASSLLFHTMIWEMFRKELTAQTVSFGTMDRDPQDAPAFMRLIKLDLGTGLPRARGLEEFKGITSIIE